MALVEVACDLCGADEADLLYPATNTASPDLQTNAYDPAQFYSSSRNQASHLPIVRCRQCGLVRSCLRDDEHTLQDIYQHLEDHVYEGEHRSRALTAADNLHYIHRFASPAGRLLDVGCATGLFLAQARSLGWAVRGVEPSVWAVDHARQRLPGIQIDCAPFEKIDYPPGSFDVITLWDVIEHIASPSQALDKLRYWLAPSGWLFMNLPDASSLPARLMGRRWVLLLREHLWYFTPQTLQAILAMYGFELRDTRPSQVRFSLANILRRTSQYPGPLGGLAGRFSHLARFVSPSIKFPIGEMKAAAQLKN